MGWKIKSIDGGENWFSINNGLTSLIVNTLAIDFKDTNVIYSGTDVGLFKTTDGGETWVELNNRLTDIKIYKIIVDYINTNLIYVATAQDGVFKSLDSGESFFEINKDLDDLRVRLLYIDSKNPKIIYGFSLGGGIYKYFNPCIIQVKTNEGGKINPTGSVEVEFGNSIEFLIYPDKGYIIKDILIDKKSIGSVQIYKFDKVENDHNIEVIFEKEKEKTILKLQIGNKTMYVNDSPQEIDVPPTIIEGRTLLPIRWVAEPLGAQVGWDGVEKKVTVTLKSTVIELWIGKNIAKVNGVDTPIDPGNPKVVPMIISGRTMLPVRFVAENLGCKVDWDAVTKTVTITYELN